MAKQAKLTKRIIEKRIERAYYSGCSGIQLNIMNIPRVFKAAELLFVSTPDISDQELVGAVRAIVDGINLAERTPS